MPVRPVLQLGDPLLREKCRPVDDVTTQEICELTHDLSDTLAHWRSTTGYGRGIAAPQIGVLQRVIFLRLPGADLSSGDLFSGDLSSGDPWPMINPQIIRRSEEKIVVWDGCLSFLFLFVQVERHREITVRYQNLEGDWLELEAGEDRNLAELLQHEIDHLDGILAIDRAIDSKAFCSRQEFEKRYRDSSPYAVVPAPAR